MDHTGNIQFRRVCTIFLLATAIAQTGSTTYASTQGTLGPTSSGSIRITVIKPAMVDISGLTDMTVTVTAANSGVTWTNDVCVYSNRAAGGYNIVATGSPGAAGAFVLSNGAGTMSYNVAWNAGGAGRLSNIGIPLSPGVPSAPLTNAATDNATCQGSAAGATARLIISVPQSALQAASPGSYSDSLTLLVAPN